MEIDHRVPVRAILLLSHLSRSGSGLEPSQKAQERQKAPFLGPPTHTSS